MKQWTIFSIIYQKAILNLKPNHTPDQPMHHRSTNEPCTLIFVSLVPHKLVRPQTQNQTYEPTWRYVQNNSNGKDSSPPHPPNIQFPNTHINCVLIKPL